MVPWKFAAAMILCAGTFLAGGGASAQKTGGDVVIAMVQAPPSIDAHVTSAQAARNITLHIYETLYARDEKAKPVPELAEGVKISEDGKTYVFPIRRGVKFHNGKDLDANDVVASLERYRKVGFGCPPQRGRHDPRDELARSHYYSEGDPVDLPRQSVVAPGAHRDLPGRGGCKAR